MSGSIVGLENKSTFPPNPYVIGVPLTGEVGFYGRSETFAAVKDALYAAQQNVIVLFGQRRVGKTSLLHQIARRVRDQERFMPVYFDLQGKERLALGEVLHLLTRTVARALKIDEPPAGNTGTTQAFRETFLPSLGAHLGEKKLLLLFDEFDVLGDDQQASSEAASYTLFPYFNELILHERQLAFIFVVGRRIEELTTSFHSVFKQAKYQRIGLMTPGEARELIILPTAGILDFSEAAIEEIVSLTERHPYLTQLLCFEVYNQAKASGNRSVTPAAVRSCIEPAMESGHGALNWFWDGLPRAERFIMSALAHVAGDDRVASKEAVRQVLERYRIMLTGLELKDAPDRLVDWDMLERHGPDNYRFKIELVRLWIRKQHPLDSVRRDVDFISQRAVRLFENAREAQEQGDLEYARDEYRRALQVNPNHSGAQLGLAQVEYELGDLDAAIADYQAAYRIEEMSARDGLVRALLGRGNQRRTEGKEDQALSDFMVVLDLQPKYEEAQHAAAGILIARGDKAVAAGDLALAEDAYEKVLAHDRSRETVEQVSRELEAFADREQSTGNLTMAMDALSRLQNLLGNDPATVVTIMQAWARLGDGLLTQGRSNEALEALQRAADLAPDDANLRARMEAVEACKAREREIDRLFERAIMSQAGGDWATVEQSCIELIKLDFLERRGRDIPELLVEARRMGKGVEVKSTAKTINTPSKPRFVRYAVMTDIVLAGMMAIDREIRRHVKYSIYWLEPFGFLGDYPWFSYWVSMILGAPIRSFLLSRIVRWRYGSAEALLVILGSIVGPIIGGLCTFVAWKIDLLRDWVAIITYQLISGWVTYGLVALLSHRKTPP